MIPLCCIFLVIRRYRKAPRQRLAIPHEQLLYPIHLWVRFWDRSRLHQTPKCTASENCQPIFFQSQETALSFYQGSLQAFLRHDFDLPQLLVLTDQPCYDWIIRSIHRLPREQPALHPDLPYKLRQPLEHQLTQEQLRFVLSVQYSL